LHRPPVLYLDEPTANLDQHSAVLVRRILRSLVADGVTVLMTTHNMEEVEEICDRVAIVNRGRLVALDTPLNLRRRHHERGADVILRDGRHISYNLERADERGDLAAQVAAGAIDSIRTREFDFRAAFLKLTGSEFT